MVIKIKSYDDCFCCILGSSGLWIGVVQIFRQIFLYLFFYFLLVFVLFKINIFDIHIIAKISIFG